MKSSLQRGALIWGINGFAKVVGLPRKWADTKGVQMTKDDLISLLRITGAQESSIDAVCAAYDAGWNDALDDYAKRLVALPFGKDTLDSFSVFIRSAKK
jgi:hypothetical protein